MRKIPLQVTALAVIAGCVVTGCGTFNGNESGAEVSAARTSTANGLLAYAPSWLRSSCSETGSNGHLAASVAGYSDSLTCALRVSMAAEVDYYQYASTGDMKAAFESAAMSGHADSPLRPGGCAAGSNENGKWSIGGAAVGEIACPVDGRNGVNLIWDDPHTNIIAIASSPHLMTAVLYEFWRSSGASIDGSAARGASSS
jgi:hypothetical protein